MKIKVAKKDVITKTTPRKVSVSNRTYIAVVPCKLWRCMYCKVLDLELGTCIIASSYSITPNSKACKYREVLENKNELKRDEKVFHHGWGV